MQKKKTKATEKYKRSRKRQLKQTNYKKRKKEMQQSSEQTNTITSQDMIQQWVKVRWQILLQKNCCKTLRAKTTSHASLHWSKILQSHLNIFIPRRTFHKNIDSTAGDIDNSIKEPQERKSQEKPQSASKFSHLKMRGHNRKLEILH